MDGERNGEKESKLPLSETEVDIFLEFPWFLCDPADVGNLREKIMTPWNISCLSYGEDGL